jgi:hypothetical protein
MPSGLLVWIVCCTWAAQQSVAASSPYGANMTDLMHHVEFFDENKDGIITITESVKGFIAIGCDPAFALTAATSTHAAFGPLTTPVCWQTCLHFQCSIMFASSFAYMHVCLPSCLISSYLSLSNEPFNFFFLPVVAWKTTEHKHPCVPHQRSGPCKRHGRL